MGSLSWKMRRRWSATGYAGHLLLYGVTGLAVAPRYFPYWGILLAGMLQGWGHGVMFNQLQVKVQEDAESQDVPVVTSFSYLIRMLAMAISSSVFGVILNEHLAKGVKASGGKITLSMLNHFQTQDGPPPKRFGRAISLYGLFTIFWAAFILVFLSLLLAICPLAGKIGRQGKIW